MWFVKNNGWIKFIFIICITYSEILKHLWFDEEKKIVTKISNYKNLIFITVFLYKSISLYNIDIN